MPQFNEYIAGERLREFNRLLNCARPMGTDSRYLSLLFVEILETRRDITRLDRRINQELHTMLKDDPNFQALVAEVTAVKATEQAAVTALNGLGTQIQTLLTNGDTSGLQDLATQLQSTDNPLAAAIVANTTPPTP